MTMVPAVGSSFRLWKWCWNHCQREWWHGTNGARIEL